MSDDDLPDTIAGAWEEIESLRSRLLEAEARAGEGFAAHSDLAVYTARLLSVMDKAWRRLDTGDAYGEDATGVMISLQEALEERLSRAVRLAQARDYVVDNAFDHKLECDGGYECDLCVALEDLKRVQKEARQDG